MSKRIVFFLFLTGCSYANDGRAISQLFFLLAMFVAACTGGGKFKASNNDAPTDTTSPTDTTDTTPLPDPEDITAPTGSISINGGDVLTELRAVVLNFTTDDATEMRYGSSETLAGASWVDFAASASFLLPDGDGNKTVYAQFRDASGNESDIVSDSIALNEVEYGVLGVLLAPEGDGFSGPIKVAGDVNGDGRDDLLTRFGSQYGSVRVVLGGNNSTTPLTLSNGVRGFSINNGAFGNGVGNIVSGDVNGDGLSDLALVRNFSYTPNVHVVHGRAVTADVDLAVPGDGGRTFYNAYTEYNKDVKLGDFNGDGLDDVIIPQAGPNTIRVVFGDDSTGAIDLASVPVTDAVDISVTWGSGIENLKYGEEHNILVLGDFNGDGKDDVFIQKYRGSYSSSFYPVVIFGDASTAPISTGSYSTRRFVIWGYANDLGTEKAIPQVGDINGDGKDDLVFPSSDGSKVTVIFGAPGSGTWQDVNATEAGIGTEGLIITGDFAPVRSSNSGVSSGSQYNSGNKYYTPKTYAGHYYYSEKVLQVADINNDGKDDIVAAGSAVSDKVYVIFGSTASGVTDIASVVASGDAVSIGGDMGGETSYLDSSYYQVYVNSYNSGPPYYTTRYYYDRRFYNYYYHDAPKLIAAGAFDADGKADIIVANQLDEATLVLGKSAPTNVNVDTATAGVFPLDASDVVDAVLLDFNGDGFKDVATVSSDGTRITIFGRLP